MCFPYENRAMQTAKQDIRALLQHLPDNATYDDIQYHLYVLEKIKRGQENIANGRSCTHEEAKARLSKWLKL